jgi:chromosome partitioning protein
LSRHVLAELDKLELPRLQTVMSEAVAYGEIGFSGAVPKEGTAVEEIAALVAELRAAGGLP